MSGERQESLEQFSGKFPLLLKKREMARIFKPDQLFFWCPDSLTVPLDQGRATVRIVSSFNEEDRYAKVRPEFILINLRHFRGKSLKGKKLTTDKPEVVREGIFGRGHQRSYQPFRIKKLFTCLP